MLNLVQSRPCRQIKIVFKYKFFGIDSGNGWAKETNVRYICLRKMVRRHIQRSNTTVLQLEELHVASADIRRRNRQPVMTVRRFVLECPGAFLTVCPVCLAARIQLIPVDAIGRSPENHVSRHPFRRTACKTRCEPVGIDLRRCIKGIDNVYWVLTQC